MLLRLAVLSLVLVLGFGASAADNPPTANPGTPEAGQTVDPSATQATEEVEAGAADCRTGGVKCTNGGCCYDKMKCCKNGTACCK